MYRINKTLVYFLIFTIIAGAIAYRLVMVAYDEQMVDYFTYLN